jgi:Rod binding domain-containing protein
MRAIGVVSAQSQSAIVPQPRLIQAAHEFEAQLMKEMLKPLASGDGSDGRDEDSGSGGPLADFATEALGQALSRQGGLGIATNILHSLSRNEKNVLSFPNTGRNEITFFKDDAAGLK